MKIKWTNKFSGETGYVKRISKKGKYFENTFDIGEAKLFSKATIDKALEELAQYCADNTYEAV